MKERPILFSAPMVRAILAGTKTQTRRVVKAKHLPWLENSVLNFLDGKWNQRPLPYGRPGDRLWVRETWAYGLHALLSARYKEEGPWVYAATNLGTQGRLCDRWRPSIHMPRQASRITLEVTGLRVERLQDISEADAIAEGIERGQGFPGWYRGPLPGDSAGLEQAGREFKIPTAFPKLAYRALWESINGPDSWEANPWVWVIEFRRLEGAAA